MAYRQRHFMNGRRQLFDLEHLLDAFRVMLTSILARRGASCCHMSINQRDTVLKLSIALKQPKCPYRRLKLSLRYV
jgi:hypothetical protein